MPTKDTSITIPGFGKLKMLEKLWKYFLTRTTIIYGSSGSGKTKVIVEIIFLLLNFIPNAFIFCPTDSANDIYTSIFPKQIIRKNPTAAVLKEIFARQKTATAVYKMANNMETLRALFARCATNQSKAMEKDIIRTSERLKKQVDESNKDFGYIKQKKTEIDEIKNEYLKDLYKKTIDLNKNRLMHMPHLSKQEKYSLIYLNFNPHILLIFDDCTSDITQLCKDPLLEEMFYTGRWFFITAVYCSHDDTSVDPKIRKNAFVSMFADSACAGGFFDKKSNGFTKDDKKVASTIISELFRSPGGNAKNYKKLVYLRQSKEFYYSIADEYNDFKFGSKFLWQLCNSIPMKEEGLDEQDPYFSAFAV